MGTLHLGHFSTSRQSSHWAMVWYPRRFKSIMVCFFASRLRRMASSSARLIFRRVAGGQLGPHIHDLHRGQRIAAVTLGKPYQLGAAVPAA